MKRRWLFPGAKTLFMAILLLASSSAAPGAERIVVLYRMTDGNQPAWEAIRQQLETKGYGVIVYQGEVDIEKHLEKVNRINRGPAAICLALDMITKDKPRTMVIEPEEKKGEGRFLAIDEIPGQFTDESRRLASDVGDAFQVKVKKLPLFPLLGVNMPGAFVRIESREDGFNDAIAKTCAGIDKYFSERKEK